MRDEAGRAMSNPPLLLGCGILQNELRFLMAKNGWVVDTDFLDSSLHVDFEALQAALQSGLARNAGRDVVVFYGACHPRMEPMLQAAHSFRTEGQNCVEMLLGRERFMDELSRGAYFLMEDWALRWDSAISKSFGNKPEVMKEIFQITCKYLLCLRTPCSGDYSEAAEKVGLQLGLPLHWLDVELHHLETVLSQALERQSHNPPISGRRDES